MRNVCISQCVGMLLSISLVPFASAQTPGEIIGYAGTSTIGYSGDGGPATSAELNHPYDVALDRAGNLYIADNENFRVRKVEAATGVITTVAGNGGSGYSGDGGLAINAAVTPWQLALDSSGNIYISDGSDSVVRKVTVSTGIITTVAGDGTVGRTGDGGPATKAEINPWGMALDSSGNIYISDGYDNVVREVMVSTGIITTVVGNGLSGYTGDGGPALDARLNSPNGIALDKDNNLYIFDQGDSTIRKVTASTHTITTVAGKGVFGYYGDGGPATNAKLNGLGIAVDDAGNLYIADIGNQRIRKVNAATGIITTVAGGGSSGNGGPATMAYIGFPYGVAVDKSANFYIADWLDSQIRKVFAGGLAQSSISLMVPPTPPLAGQSFELIAQLTGLLDSPAPTGTVTLYNGTTPLESAALNSSAKAVLTTSLSAGTYQITARYSGDKFYNPSISQTTSMVVAASATEPPYFGPPSGTYTHNLQVAIYSPTPGMSIIYTTNGTTPTFTNGVFYQGAIPITVNTAIKAIAVDLTSPPHYADSRESTASYVLHLPYEAPLPQGEWAWESGVSSPNGNCNGTLGVLGVYGTLGVSSPANLPGSRQLATQWTDKNGNLWLFGGSAVSASGTCTFVNDLWMFNNTTKEWVWMSGSDTYPNGFQPGVYGTQGKFAPDNVPGSRVYSVPVTWTDKSGNLWLFGGFGYDSTGKLGYLNELWEFNPSIRQWAWMGGSKFANQNGNYGTLHVVHAGNNPGSRDGAVGWTDRYGNFWLFGGFAFDSAGNVGAINDLWEFNTSTRQWVWMGGSHLINQYGVYGNHNLPSPANIPGARQSAMVWVDAEGKFWLFGGVGNGAAPFGGFLNDLWEFNPSNLNWTWASGSAYGGTYPAFFLPPGQGGVYDKLGVPDPGNTPGSRDGAATWTDAHGNLWLFGGTGFDSMGNEDSLDDLWEFDRSKWLWAWMGGSSIAQGSAGKTIYGTYRVPSPQTQPGPRSGAASWTDKNGNLWLFGGEGRNGSGATALLNDLFEYRVP